MRRDFTVAGLTREKTEEVEMGEGRGQTEFLQNCPYFYVEISKLLMVFYLCQIICVCFIISETNVSATNQCT